jgi:3-oxoacyl-[acyl-carrier protein] reductase
VTAGTWKRFWSGSISNPCSNEISFAASKAGLIHLTRCMAVALAPETRDARQLRRAPPSRGHASDIQSRSERIERSAATSLPKKPANKDDGADMVVTICRTDTMTGRTIVIDPGRYCH